MCFLNQILEFIILGRVNLSFEIGVEKMLPEAIQHSSGHTFEAWCCSLPPRTQHLGRLPFRWVGRVGRKLGDISDAKERKRENRGAAAQLVVIKCGAPSLSLSLAPNGKPTGERERSNNHHAISGTVGSAESYL